ncbi:MAG: hypothetical protein HY226_03775, partial [Candidatus Vogelbacteria bacterium]|nr:hypothetical protein [Candidatus Vogelbacteria bacterium]
MKVNNIFYIAVIVLLGTVFWVYVVAPHLTKLSDDFTYRADIVSLDNLYDEQKQEFSGEKRSVTKFSYEAMADKNGVLTIRN